MATFLARFVEISATFYSNIRSHWVIMPRQVESELEKRKQKSLNARASPMNQLIIVQMLPTHAKRV